MRAEFAEWTADGNLRAPVYKGLEIDADARSVVRERARQTVEAANDAGADSPGVGEASSAGRAAAVRRPPTPAIPARSPVVTVPGGPAPGRDRVSSEELEALDVLPGKGGPWSVGGLQLKLSNLDKVLWSSDGITKRDLIRYYVTIAPYLLPYLRGRALTLQRYPGRDRSARLLAEAGSGPRPRVGRMLAAGLEIEGRAHGIPHGRLRGDAGMGGE